MKKKYDTLLFDVDDTLLDFGAAETQALGKLFNDLGIELDAEIVQPEPLEKTRSRLDYAQTAACYAFPDFFQEVLLT